MAKTNLMSVVLENYLEGYTLGQDGKLKVINEKAAKRAEDALAKLVLEKSRHWWNLLEAGQDSLRGVMDQVRFEELNADPSRLSAPGVRTGMVQAPQAQPNSANAMAGQNPMGAGQPGAMGMPMGGDPMGGAGAPTLESLLGSKDFDLKRIFEMDFGQPQSQSQQRPMMDAEGDMDVQDGDQDFSDMQSGHDDAGMGAVGDMNDAGGNRDIDAIGRGESDSGDATMGGDAMGGGADLDISGSGGDGFDLDFRFLNGGEEGGMGGEEGGMGGDEMGGDAPIGGDQMGGDMGGQDDMGGEMSIGGDESGMGDLSGDTQLGGDDFEKTEEEPTEQMGSPVRRPQQRPMGY